MFKDEDSPASPYAPLGDQSKGMFVYRTLEDLDLMSAHAEKATRCAVIGGGLLGLEAARAVQGCGLEAHVVELAPRLMPRRKSWASSSTASSTL